MKDMLASLNDAQKMKQKVRCPVAVHDGLISSNTGTFCRVSAILAFIHGIAMHEVCGPEKVG
jgi:hypothetical protein